MSIANCFVPVTISSASIRRCGVPTSASADCGLSCGRTIVVFDTAPSLASSPNVSERPSGAVTTPPLTVISAAWRPSILAAVCASWPRAVAAAVLTGV